MLGVGAASVLRASAAVWWVESDAEPSPYGPSKVFVTGSDGLPMISLLALLALGVAVLLAARDRCPSVWITVLVNVILAAVIGFELLVANSSSRSSVDEEFGLGLWRDALLAATAAALLRWLSTLPARRRGRRVLPSRVPQY